MEQSPDWVSMVNVNLADHEARLRGLERANGQDGIVLDDVEYTWPPGNLDGYDLRTAAERQAARLDNHDQRLAAGVGLAACAAQLLEALDAAAGAESGTARGFPRITAIVVGTGRREESHEDAKAQRWHEGEIGDWEIRQEVKVGIVPCVWLRPGLASRRVS